MCQKPRVWTDVKPHLKCLCLGASAPARKPAVQENVRQGLHNVQNRELSCRRKSCCRSAQPQKPQLQGAQIPSLPLQDRHVPAFLPPIGNLSLKLCLHRCSIRRDSTCLQNCTDGLDGKTCLITITISHYYPVFFIFFKLYH